MKVGIVGAGMAGLSCAAALAAAGHTAMLFDKGRAPGGRMSTRRVPTPVGEASFDHGAQYATARDPAFLEQMHRWATLGLTAPWPAAGTDAWVGTPGMNAMVKHMAASLSVRWSRQIDALTREGEQWQVGGEACDAVLVAVPAEQAAPLLRPWQAEFATVAAATRAAPCWTVMAAFAEPLPIAADVLRQAGVVGWAARNSAKPSRSGPEAWVVQANPDWSRAHLEQEPGTVVAPLLNAFAEATGIVLPDPLSATAHRWRFARSGDAGRGALWDPALRLGACGDWLAGPRVEAAWLSGQRLATLVGAPA